MRHLTLAAISFVFLSFFTHAAFAANQYTLNSVSSSLHFVSVKNTVVAETHSFTKLSGQIDQDGKASVSIDLASAETHIELRNERLASMLFQIADFPKATISAELDKKLLKSLKAGEALSTSLDLLVDLHGKQKTYTVALRISKLANGTVNAITEAPVLINALDFALGDGLEQLRDIAKLKDISPIVAVTANLNFVAAK